MTIDLLGHGDVKARCHHCPLPRPGLMELSGADLGLDFQVESAQMVKALRLM